LKLTFSLTALSFSITFLSFQGSSFSTAEIKNEAKIPIVPNTEFANYFNFDGEYFHQYEESKIENILSGSSKNAPGSDRYVLV